MLAWSRLAGVPGPVRPAAADAADAPAWAVATPAALVVVAASGVRVERGWHDVDAATWDDEESLLRVSWVDGAPPLDLVLEREAGTFLPEVMRERVQASVLLARRVDLTSGGTVRVVLRRGPGDPPVLTQVLPGPGVDLDDPAVAGQVERARRALRGAAGLE